MNAAEESIADKNYFEAMFYYSQAVEFDSTALDIRNSFGESALMFNAYTNAETELQYVVDNDSEAAYPLAVLKLAEAQQNLGKYDIARRNYELYLSESRGDDAYYTAKAEKEIEAIDWAIDKADNPAFGTDVNRIEGSVNTPYSEFGGVTHNDNFYYSSLQFIEESDDYNTDRLYSRVLSSESDELVGTTVESIVPEKIDGKKKKKDNSLDDLSANSGEHIAHTAFSTDGGRVYYTLCHYLNATDIRCDIYVSDVDADGGFRKGTKLPASINGNDFTSTQPTIGYDLVLDKEVIYYSSDREGGEGKNDIWYNVIDGDNYGEAVNITDINTSDDEITPYYHTGSGMLYFSSDGYLGMGGFDVFKTYKSGNTYAQAENMLAPINSSFNDIYFSLEDNDTDGYISSNRTGSLYLEEGYEACCYDIYKVKIEEIFIDLNALTFNEETRDSLLGARVQIIDAITGELLFENLNDLGHDHKFKIKCNREYIIVTTKDGYDPDTTNLSIKDCSKTDLVKKIYLTPQDVKLQVLTFDENSLDELNGATVTLEADGIEPIVITNANANDFNFDIVAGRDYLLTVERKGFITEQLVVNSNNVIDGIVTERVYLRRDDINLNEYLPVVVYYDNDIPDPRTKKLFTATTYSETYFDYIGKKEEFKTKYAKTLSGDLRSGAASELEYFFESDVKNGYATLQMFISKLKQRLESGDIIELSLKGFASPRAANRYNLALGQRRIWSIKNEIKAYAGGVLAPYIESGKLVVTEISFGEEIAPSGISDSYSNRRLSVYSPEASRQRKAEIVRVRVLN
ncbi:hypothetical protein N9L92_03665 [Saprospiraceae bacterium]|nr:hypothetical protein [Saprospiraceae bacterium]